MKTFLKWYNHIEEELPGTATPSVVGTGDDSSTVVVKRKKKRKMFDVPPHIFKRFENNEKVKYERWQKYLGQGMYEDKMLQYIKDNRSSEIVLRDQTTGDIKTIKSI